MDAADLRVVAAIARTGSMSKAASEVSTVQANVTARIKALEGVWAAACSNSPTGAPA